MAVFLLLVVVVLTFLFHQFWWRLQHLPAGPLPLPIIGNAHSFVKSERWERQFVEWKERYGKIYTYWMGPLPIIAVNDHQLMVDMTGTPFADRCTFEPLDIAARGGLFGIISVSGDLWVEQRRFFLRTMREFGLGRNQMQGESERVEDESNHIMVLVSFGCWTRCGRSSTA
ncbi:Cytochrome P450 [Aphelenchoides fujianensis]|nr:Cytochrome P450 [Aphelenchoides fujianensis]